jgi:N-methylhydantoinase A
MIAFGGAAPLHAGRLCEKLGVDRLLVPTGAGVGSAIGFLRAPFSFEATRSVYMKLSDFAPDIVRTLLRELETEATGFVRTCDADAPIKAEYKVYMRYTGQGWEIPITLNAAQAADPDAATFQALFEADYTTLFGRTVAGMDIEITVWAVNATTHAALADPIGETPIGAPGMIDATRSLFDPAQATASNAAVVLRGTLNAGDTVTGPALITEDETTIVVPNSRTAIARPDGTIDITEKRT